MCILASHLEAIFGRSSIANSSREFGPSLRIRSIVATESDPDLGAISTNLFPGGPLAWANETLPREYAHFRPHKVVSKAVWAGDNGGILFGNGSYLIGTLGSWAGDIFYRAMTLDTSFWAPYLVGVSVSPFDLIPGKWEMDEQVSGVKDELWAQTWEQKPIRPARILYGPPTPPPNPYPPPPPAPDPDPRRGPRRKPKPPAPSPWASIPFGLLPGPAWGNLAPKPWSAPCPAAPRQPWVPKWGSAGWPEVPVAPTTPPPLPGTGGGLGRRPRPGLPPPRIVDPETGREVKK